MDSRLLELGNKLERHVRTLQLRTYERLNVVTAQSPYDNVFYCCTQKTASQWFKAVFSDPIFFQHSGLRVVPHLDVVRPDGKLALRGPLPPRTIATHLYVDFATYATIPKPVRYRTFFMLRDPRDVVVSWYFSTKYSHHPYPKVLERRQKLEKFSFRGGMKFAIDELAEEGLFHIQRSWMKAFLADPSILIVRYEEFARDNAAFLRRLVDYVGARLSDREFSRLYERHTFQKYARKRSPGEHDPLSHYRNGMEGDWRNHFDCELQTYFSEVTGDLLECLGYV